MLLEPPLLGVGVEKGGCLWSAFQEDLPGGHLYGSRLGLFWGVLQVEYWLLDIPCKIQRMLQKEPKCASLTGGPWTGSASVKEDIPDTVIMQHDEEALRGVYLAIVS